MEYHRVTQKQVLESETGCHSTEVEQVPVKIITFVCQTIFFARQLTTYLYVRIVKKDIGMYIIYTGGGGRFREDSIYLFTLK